MKPVELSERRKILEPEFFDRAADVVARDLLGVSLVRRLAAGDVAFAISETEAYLGAHDRACHSSRGRTARTEKLFGPPGTLYVYLVYGLHLLLNVVTGPKGIGGAVLIRSTTRSTGPGRVGKSLDLSLALNGRFASEATGLWFEDRGAARGPIRTAPRVGVDYAGPRWARRKLRFLLDTS